VYRETFKRENAWQQILVGEASSPLRGQSSNTSVSEVADTLISKTTDYMFGIEVTVGFPLVRT
jgi:hypothetical protein